MNFLSGKRILVGVTGGIAAYKGAELVRQLRGAGAHVRVMMTAAAKEFVGARTFQALSGEPVWADWSDDQTGMDHISLARWADCVVIAPASADTLSRIASGRADDLLAAVCLACKSPLLLAPAMNQAMWSNPATRDNVALLQERGAQMLGPAEGEQACGETGAGRMLEPFALVEAVSSTFANDLLAGLKVLVTAGPTREPLDPVRFLSNRSSGKMGYAVAAAAREAGAEVQLISGPVTLDVPVGVRCVTVETAAEMFDAVMADAGSSDILVAAAAVADYRPTDIATQKIKKQHADWALPLTPVKDILAAAADLRPRPFCVGFAAETGQLEQNAEKKRRRKNVDMIAANQVGQGLGFDSDSNELLLVWEGGQLHLPKDNKQRLAVALIEQIAKRYRKLICSKVEHHAKHSA